MKLSVFAKVAVVATLGLIACAELSGTITLNRALNVVDKKGKQIQVPAGSFQAEFEYKEDKRQVELEIKNVIEGKKDVEMRLQVPAGKEIPRHSGPFALLGAEVGQNFDLVGDLDTNVHETSPTGTTESCTYTDYERVCERRCYDRVDRQGRHYQDCRRECWDRAITRYGSREVEYHHVITDIKVVADLREPSSQEVIGKLNVDRHDSRLVYDYQGRCY